MTIARTKPRFAGLLVLAAVQLVAGAVEATNGYFSHGYGTQAKGMAGVAAAVAARSGTTPRAVDVGAVQAELRRQGVELGALP